MSNKITYSEKYKKGVSIKNSCLPVLNHLSKGFKVESANLLEAGRFADGKEYQVIKVVVFMEDDK